LLVEDYAADRRLIEEYFKESGRHRFALHFCETLEQCKAYLHEHSVDLVLLDLHLPDSHGLETFESLNRDFPGLPVVVLTGRHAEDESIGVRSIEKGAQEFLSKTELNSQVLQRTVRYAIQRKQMMRRLDQAQQMAKMGTWGLDLQTNELTCSPTLYAILEKDSTHSLLHFGEYLEVVHPDDQEKVALCIKRACQHQASFKVDHRIEVPGGRIKYISLQGQMEEETPYHDAPRMVGTAQDITERAQVEVLTREKELADKSAKLRQDFLAKTSHEIRTPLNPILVLTDMLLRTEVTAEQREYLGIIRTAGDTLLALVNDILDLSKIEAGKIEFDCQPFNLSNVFNSIRDMMDINAKEKNIALNIDISPELPDVVEGDPVRLTQILLNLVGNAIKFTHGGEIQVTARQQSWVDDVLSVSFAVKDTGIGIPQDKLKVIFESFQQLESNVTRQYGGTGLGLTIVRQLVLLQGGQIFVESEVGVGSTFYFDLSFKVPSKDEEEQISESVSSALDTRASQVAPVRQLDQTLLEGLSVLLVEDNPLNQMVTKKLLNDWGIDVEIANNGKEGVAYIEDYDFDLVLMDIQMPEMDGYEATRHIRSQFPAPKRDVPIVALTANAFTGSDDECMRAGMNDYLSKPIEIGNLFDKIVAQVRRKPPFDPSRRLQPVSSHHRAEEATSGSHSKATYHPELDSTSAEAMPQTYTDLSYLNEISGGETEVIKAAVAKFVASTPEMLDQLDQQLANGDYEQLAKTAHKLKSSVAFMGIDAIKSDIEQMARGSVDHAKLPGMVAEIRSVVQASFDELQTAVSRM